MYNIHTATSACATFMTALKGNSFNKLLVVPISQENNHLAKNLNSFTGCLITLRSKRNGYEG